MIGKAMRKMNCRFAAIVLLWFSAINCNNSKADNYFTLIMKSPLGCTHIVKIDNEGNGVIEVSTESNSTIEFQGLNENLKKTRFKINDDSILKSFKGLVATAGNQDYLETARPKDVIHYELFVQNVKKIDAYGRKSEIINSLKELLEGFYPFKIDYTCEQYVE